MTDQIEQVARALCDDAGCVWDHDPQALSRIEWRKASCAAIAAMTVQAEPVAVVGNNWSLRWAPQETLTEIAKRTGIKVGSPLYAHPPVPQSSDAEIARLTEALRAAEEEIEERDEWTQIVDTTPLDGFDALADSWISRPAITRMLNAISSVFTKYAPEQIMVRFRKGMGDIMHQSFVEGCIVGVKNERARAALKEQPHADTD